MLLADIGKCWTEVGQFSTEFDNYRPTKPGIDKNWTDFATCRTKVSIPIKFGPDSTNLGPLSQHFDRMSTMLGSSTILWRVCNNSGVVSGKFGVISTDFEPFLPSLEPNLERLRLIFVWCLPISGQLRATRGNFGQIWTGSTEFCAVSSVKSVDRLRTLFRWFRSTSTCFQPTSHRLPSISRLGFDQVRVNATNSGVAWAIFLQVVHVRGGATEMLVRHLSCI